MSDSIQWEELPGSVREASLEPGSGDISLMAGLLAELGEVEAPDVPGLRTAAEAEAVVMGVPAWARADPEQVTAHAVSGAETWYRANNQYPVPRVWRDIIREWARYRSLST